MSEPHPDDNYPHDDGLYWDSAELLARLDVAVAAAPEAARDEITASFALDVLDTARRYVRQEHIETVTAKLRARGEL